MFELSEESDLMISDDGAVRLTTHRVIYEGKGGRQQMMLEDFQSYEIRQFHIGNYWWLMILFSFLTIALLVDNVIDYIDLVNFYKSLGSDYAMNYVPPYQKYLLQDAAFMFSLVLLAFSFVFISISRRCYIDIQGRFNAISIRIKSPERESVKAFLDQLTLQSKKVQKRREE